MPDWNTRLAVNYETEDGDGLISPILSISTNFNRSAEAISSLEETHIGYSEGIPALTFTMTVNSIGTTAAELIRLAVEGIRFEISVQEQRGSDWTLKSKVMSDCLITSAGEAHSLSGMPTMTFSGIALSGNVTKKDGVTSELPVVAEAEGG